MALSGLGPNIRPSVRVHPSRASVSTLNLHRTALEQAHSPVKSSYIPGHLTQRSGAPASRYLGASSFPSPALARYLIALRVLPPKQPTPTAHHSLRGVPREACVSPHRGKGTGGGTRILEPRGGRLSPKQPISTRDSPNRRAR